MATIVWAFDATYSALVVIAARRSVRPFPVSGRSARIAVAAGCVALLAGLTLYACGIVQLGSPRRASGRATVRLVTTGVYRWTRNPRYVGWTLVLLGAVLIGRSSVAFVLALGFWLPAYIAIRAE